MTQLKPILKWAGGKESELGVIAQNMPKTFQNYYEPFVGGGSVYLHFRAQRYFINDKSKELATLYKYIFENNLDFYAYAEEIDNIWVFVQARLSGDSSILSLYKHCRETQDLTIDFVKMLSSLVRKYINLFDNQLKTNALSLIAKQDAYVKQVVAKFKRIKKLETQKGWLSDKDLKDNILTAFLGPLYLHFRTCYNEVAKTIHHSPLHIALFLFIRNFAYSGMFRYNSKGDFNVPYGGISYNSKTLAKKLDYYKQLAQTDKVKATYISNEDFESFLYKTKPSADDFIFIDPPYDSAFSNYAGNEFGAEDQKRLATYLCQKCPAKWMIIIKNTPFIYGLYNHPKIVIKSFDKRYAVSFKNRNDPHAEHLLITNYHLK